VGTKKQFDYLAARNFLKAALKIRRKKPSVTLDLVGDVRERWFARFAGSKRHIYIGWAPDHPYSRLIRNPFGAARPFLTIPASAPNVYVAYGRMLDFLAPLEGQAEVLSPRLEVCTRNGALRIGLHPFASQASKLWPFENWQELVRELLVRGAELIAFSAPNERSTLQALFSGFGQRITIVAGDISEFASAVAKLDLLVGLDSFSVHMAHRQGVRSITINGGTPAQLWAIPSGHTLASSGDCQHYPCYNVPRCERTVKEYACVKSISPAEVLAAIDSMAVSTRSF
jgi:heptosyltransferase-3